MADPGQRVALITGANTGIGRAIARRLAARGWHVIMTGRQAATIETVARAIQQETDNPHVVPLTLDLADFDSIDRAVGSVLRDHPQLHVLINNAGLAPRRRQRTASGFEQAFGVNHIGHFRLTLGLWPRLRESGAARVVTVASHAHYAASSFDWDRLREPTRSRLGYREYATSKLANVLFSAELSRRTRDTGVTTYAVHPGVVASDIWRHLAWPVRRLLTLAMISSDEGAETPVHCAISPASASETGLYYDKCRPRAPSARAQDAGLARELWERSERWTGTRL